MKGYGMGNKDHMADRQKRLAARYPERVPKEPTTHVVVDGELFVFGDKSVEVYDDIQEPILPEEAAAALVQGAGSEPEKKKGGRPKGSKNKAKD